MTDGITLQLSVQKCIYHHLLKKLSSLYVVFQQRNPPIPDKRLVSHLGMILAICIPPLFAGGEGLWSSRGRSLFVQPLVLKVGKVDSPIINEHGSTSVLMHPCAGTEPLGCPGDIALLAYGGRADYVATTLGVMQL